MNITGHLERARESIEVIEESIEKGIVERQRNIGFNASAACVDMLEILLHKTHLIDPGFIIKHEWFRSPNTIKEKFPFDFHGKNEIIGLIADIEYRRDALCYGKPQQAGIIGEVIEKFNRLKKKFREAGLDEI